MSLTSIFQTDKFKRSVLVEGHVVPEPARAPGEIHLPAPSYYPILVALGIVAVVAGALIHLWVSIVGAIVMVYGAYRFAFEYRSEAHT